ncbi:MAG: DUF4266 domain-containing protein [Kangiellaceae bacterium]
MNQVFIKILIGLFLLISIFGLTSCSSIEPWVKPYERQNLADPITFFGRDPVSDNYMHHVRQARESARGAEGSAGGGCGCN